MLLAYGSYEYTVKNSREIPVHIDATNILLEDVKNGSKWWFRVNHKCLGTLTLYHEIGK